MFKLNLQAVEGGILTQVDTTGQRLLGECNPVNVSPKGEIFRRWSKQQTGPVFYKAEVVNNEGQNFLLEVWAEDEKEAMQVASQSQFVYRFAAVHKTGALLFIARPQGCGNKTLRTACEGLLQTNTEFVDIHDLGA